MIGREKRVLLRHYLEQGMNKAVIARDLGVSRRTVYHWIETGRLDRELDEERVGYGPRCLMPSKLDRSLSTPVRHSWELIREQSPVS